MFQPTLRIGWNPKREQRPVSPRSAAEQAGGDTRPCGDAAHPWHSLVRNNIESCAFA